MFATQSQFNQVDQIKRRAVRGQVESPRSLLRKSAERLYIPRQDKFEGYSQFPRPRIPPEVSRANSFANHKTGKILQDDSSRPI